MNETYRGFTIRLEQAGAWNAKIIEMSTGATLPTMATALLGEGPRMALVRARKLIDVYACALEAIRDAA
ncbi:MAG: hypothetical protein ACO1OG_10965 [Devosia sp.]